MLTQTLLIALVAFIGYLRCFVGDCLLDRPLILGPLVGLVLGDLQTGVIVGATLELAFMGNVAIGAALPPELTAGSILGTAFAITSHSGAAAALALALPIATIALLVKNLIYIIIRSAFVHKADTYAEMGDTDGVSRMHIYCQFVYGIGMTLIIAICFYSGNDAVKQLLSIVPAFITNGLTAATKILPALGFAMLTRMIINKKVAPFFLLGFLLSAYLKLPVLGIALFAVVVALVIINNMPDNKIKQQEVSSDDEF